MRRIHSSLLGALLVGTAAVLAGTVPGVAQNKPAAGTVKAKPAADGIYAGTAAAVEGLKLGGWGSGLASEDRTYRTIGDNSIKIETNGYYAGARITFDQPRDLTEQKQDPYGFLEFIIRFQPGKAKPASTGGPGGPMAGAYPGSSGNEGASAGAGDFLMGSPDGEQALNPDTHKLKVVMVCEEGTFVASHFPVMLQPAQEEGWFSVAIPYVAFKGMDKVQTVKMNELRIFGDSKDTFWIGEIKTTSDDEPITVDPIDELEVSVGEAVEFRSAATGGISPLHYSWDFDLSDSIQEDSTGPAVVHVFRKPSPPVPGQAGELQPYVVTLTVSDLSGAKRSVRRQTSVIVNP
ncbi:MAG: hypothetical protein K0Q72_5294 [Armatimonadetes bacterium]|jgi:hypothetical protein|nr:hypothetical protein [Armatimonadota bacterium]